jgi:hypothetical protein
VAIWGGGHDHRLPFPSDNGVRFEPRAERSLAVETHGREGLTGRDLSAWAPPPRTGRQRGFRLRGGIGFCPPTVSPAGVDEGGALTAVVSWEIADGVHVRLSFASEASAVSVQEVALGSQPAELAGWLVAEAVTAVAGQAPSTLIMERLTAEDLAVAPVDAPSGRILRDAAEDLECGVLGVTVDTDGGVPRLTVPLLPWPTGVPRW